MAAWFPTRRNRGKVRARFADLTDNLALIAATCAPRVPDASANTQSRRSVPVAQEGRKTTVSSTANRPDDLRKTDPSHWNRHHIPPRHPQPFLLKRVLKKHHEAYHLLFGTAQSFEACVEILRQHWWPVCFSGQFEVPEVSQCESKATGAEQFGPDRLRSV